MDGKALSLGEILTTITDDLYAAENARMRSGREGRLAVNQVELELSVSTAEEASGSLKFYILGAGVSGRSESASVLRITLGTAEGASPVGLDALPTSGESVRQREYLSSIERESALAEFDRLIDEIRAEKLDPARLLDRLQHVRTRLG